ncbi:MAG TPA: hypothetical protein VK447_01230 [Myxococcaceae bacterium]|nr:hypothetical protein [Myxococcaceae bacterium]
MAGIFAQGRTQGWTGASRAARVKSALSDVVGAIVIVAGATFVVVIGAAGVLALAPLAL